MKGVLPVKTWDGNKDESNLSEENNDQDQDDHTAFVYEDFDATDAVTPDLERKSDETEEVIIEEEKDTFDVKSGDTEELDLERIQKSFGDAHDEGSMLERMVGLEYEMQQDRESLEAISMITRNSRAFDYSVGVTAICGLDSYLNNPFWRRGFGLDKWVMSASVRQESEDWKI
ncbi:hypothetical protein Tco_0494284 [Tanacetum coccineum]